MNIEQNTSKLLDFISDKFTKRELNNESLVQLIELAGGFLNLETIPRYAKREGKSYNGVKKHRQVRKLFNVKFVIDNL